jgi:hypothetical protein
MCLTVRTNPRARMKRGVSNQEASGRSFLKFTEAIAVSENGTSNPIPLDWDINYSVRSIT